MFLNLVFYWCFLKLERIYVKILLSKNSYFIFGKSLKGIQQLFYFFCLNSRVLFSSHLTCSSHKVISDSFINLLPATVPLYLISIWLSATIAAEPCKAWNRSHSFIQYIRKIFRKANISNFLIFLPDKKYQFFRKFWKCT